MSELLHPELAGVHVKGASGDLSRGEVILKGALATAAVYGAVAVGPFVSKALAISGSGDVDILNFLLAFEYLETTFYLEATSKAKATGDLQFLIELLADYEPQHGIALAAAIKELGGKPVAEPKFDFPYDDPAGFLELAQTFEDTGVSAYNGAAPSIKSGEALALAGAIAQIEGRHAAAVRLQNKRDPAPDAFDPSLDEAQVQALVDRFVP